MMKVGSSFSVMDTQLKMTELKINELSSFIADSKRFVMNKTDAIPKYEFREEVPNA